LGFHDAELSVTLTSDEAIAEIAGDFGRSRSPTDVLAFSMLEGAGVEFRGDALGDVIISLDSAERQARHRGVSLQAEVRQLLIHGILHLLGMDHERDADRRRMRELEAHLAWTLLQGDP
jgi:probable rRNA maturation factor